MACANILIYGTVHASPEESSAYSEIRFSKAEVTGCGVVVIRLNNLFLQMSRNRKKPLSSLGLVVASIKDIILNNEETGASFSALSAGCCDAL